MAMVLHPHTDGVRAGDDDSTADIFIHSAIDTADAAAWNRTKGGVHLHPGLTRQVVVRPTLDVLFSILAMIRIPSGLRDA
jgi:hypothetical protein